MGGGAIQRSRRSEIRKHFLARRFDGERGGRRRPRRCTNILIGPTHKSRIRIGLACLRCFCDPYSFPGRPRPADSTLPRDMLNSLPRYIAAFHPKSAPHYFTDVLVVGGGLAGLRAAMAVDPSQRVLVVTKEAVRESNSAYAQGGIAGVLDPQDRFEDHEADTLSAGRGLCDRAVVEAVVRDAPGAIQELIDWGVQFDRDSGELALGREGGHSHHRIVHALGDMTGKEVMRVVIERARSLKNVELWPDTFTVDLLTNEEKCRGALVWNPAHGKTLVWANQTILCTGGVGQLYRETTNPPVATGDGLAAAFRAGAELRDMEFMQFHPTVLYIAGSSRILITEAVRGFDAHLVDATGKRFMFDYDERGELAPRDVVSRAIVAQMAKTRHPNVYLSLTHLDQELVRARFPGIVRTCRQFNLDVAQDWIPVRPGAHYMVGGVTVDHDGRTTLPGLWGAGEATSSGLHGANRLASNSLLEGLVYGARAGRGASAAAASEPSDVYRIDPIMNPTASVNDEPLDVDDVRNSIKSLMWRNVGVERDRESLQEATERLDQYCRYVLVRQFDRPPGWELQNLLIVGRLMAAAALEREESRGVHQRTDFPEVNEEIWRRQISYRRTDSN